jgi:hypothetical protein
MGEVSTIGMDIAKSVFDTGRVQDHGRRLLGTCQRRSGVACVLAIQSEARSFPRQWILV